MKTLSKLVLPQAPSPIITSFLYQSIRLVFSDQIGQAVSYYGTSSSASRNGIATGSLEVPDGLVRLGLRGYDKTHRGKKSGRAYLRITLSLCCWAMIYTVARRMRPFAEQMGDDREDDRVSGLDQLDFLGVLTTIATREQTGVREV